MAGKRKFGFGRLKIIILVGVLIYMGISYVSQQSIFNEQLKKRQELITQQEELERELDFKKSALDYIGSNEYVEQQAKERLGWIKEDEVKYVESNTSSASGQTEPPAQTGEPTTTNEPTVPIEPADDRGPSLE